MAGDITAACTHIRKHRRHMGTSDTETPKGAGAGAGAIGLKQVHPNGDIHYDV